MSGGTTGRTGTVEYRHDNWRHEYTPEEKRLLWKREMAKFREFLFNHWLEDVPYAFPESRFEEYPFRD